jgi:hypothetical protein
MQPDPLGGHAKKFRLHFLCYTGTLTMNSKLVLKGVPPHLLTILESPTDFHH